MKKKLSLTEKISLAENNAVDFMHACVTIALHDEYEVGVQRLRKVNLRRDEINEEMLEVMAQPRKSGREQAAAGQAWLVSLLPEGAETEFRVRWARARPASRKSCRSAWRWTTPPRWSGGYTRRPAPRCWALEPSG